MTIQQFNKRAGIAIIILLGFNSYMNTIEIEAIQDRLDEKNLLCKQVYTIKTKLNVVMECMELSK